MSETATAALNVLYGLLLQGLGPRDEQVEAAFKRVRQGIYRLEEDVRGLRKEVTANAERAEKAEKAAKEATEANQAMAEAIRELREQAAKQAATLAKVLNYLVKSWSTY